MSAIKGVRIAQEGIREWIDPDGWGLVPNGADSLLPGEGGYHYYINYLNESGQERELTLTFSKSALEKMLANVREY